MTADAPERAALERSVQALTERVIRAVRGPDHTYSVATFADSVADEPLALAAIRVVGVDALAPYLLGRGRPGERDLRVVGRCLDAAGRDDAPQSARTLVRRLRDRATRQALDRLCGLPPGPGEPVSSAPLDAVHAQGWPQWSVVMSQLAPLTLCPVELAVHEHARRHAADLERGVVRCLLRRDHPTATRLARWLTLPGMPCRLDLPAILRHLGFYLTGGTRAALDLAIAERTVRRRVT